MLRESEYKGNLAPVLSVESTSIVVDNLREVSSFLDYNYTRVTESNCRNCTLIRDIRNKWYRNTRESDFAIAGVIYELCRQRENSGITPLLPSEVEELLLFLCVS